MKTEEKKHDAVIISSYKYDHPFTDMNCAWSTIYTIFYLDGEGHVSTVKVGTGWGQDFEDVAPNVNIIKMTDEIKEKYFAYLKKESERRAEEGLKKFQADVEKYNEARRPQKIGQIVEVLDGKHKGKFGKISWFGHNKFKRSRYKSNSHWSMAVINYLSEMKPYVIPNQDCDLILVRPDEGEKFYIDPSRCKVVEGFEPISITKEDVRRMNKHHDDIVSNFHIGTAYDHKDYV